MLCNPRHSILQGSMNNVKKMFVMLLLFTGNYSGNFDWINCHVWTWSRAHPVTKMGSALRVLKPPTCTETHFVFRNPSRVLKPPMCTKTPHVYRNPPSVLKPPTCTETHHMCRNPHVYWNPPRVLKPPTCTETPHVYRNPSRVPKPPTCTETQPSGGLARVNRRFCN